MYPLTLALALLVGGCTGGSPSPRLIRAGDERVAPRQLVSVHDGLCEALREAASKPEAAKAAFFGRSHSGLHTIARALENVDRARAARLLVAKQAVEAKLSADQPPPGLADDLTRLSEATRSALERLSVDVKPCPAK